MKNIHVLPTDKPSRLRKYIFEGFALSKQSLNWKEAKHIYITNSEEIKEGDWVYYENGGLKGIHKVVNGQRPKTMYLKKIILTTDQDLIADGVQAIDDEFLEWFVKNPSCEVIEVEHIKVDDARPSGYKIAIPKEEPKQDLRKYPLTPDECFKQETLEEVAEKYANKIWDYSNSNEKLLHANCTKAFIKGAKWQQEQNKNKYSEEEVRLMLRELSSDLYEIYPLESLEQWFEQFKKK